MENNNINEIFSNNLNYWLQRRGKTQADLYKQMGVSSATASDWCNNKKMPRADKLVMISKWLMIELSDLLDQKTVTDNIMNDIIFRLKDDSEFYDAVTTLYDATQENFYKILEYENLLCPKKKEGEN